MTGKVPPQGETGQWKHEEFVGSFYYLIASLFCLAPKCVLSVRNHTAHWAGSVKPGRTAAVHAEKWNPPPASNTPGRILDTRTPLFYAQLLLVPQVSFVFQHLITLFRFNLYTSATDSQAAFLKKYTIKYDYTWLGKKELLPHHNWGYRVPLDPVRLRYRSTEYAQVGQSLHPFWPGRLCSFPRQMTDYRLCS